MRRSWTSGLVGLVIAASASFGVGVAEAAPAAPGKPLYCTTLPVVRMTALQKEACGLVGAAAGAASDAASGVTSAVPRRTQSPRPRAPVRVPVREVEEAVGGLTGSSSSGQTAQRPPATRPRSSGSGSGSSSAPARPAPAPAAAPAARVPVAPTQDYGLLMAAAYDRVPVSLLATSAPFGRTGVSLLSPTSFRPGSLLSGRPGRTLVPADAADGVTSASTASLFPAGSEGRLGTPLLVGVLTASALIALAVRSSVLRRGRRRPA